MGRPTRFNQVQADAFLGATTDNSPFGKVWYVDGTNGADGNAGDAPDEAFASIGQAITAATATRGDTVVIYPGTYTITTALSPKAFMTFKAAIVNPQAPSVSIRGNLASLMNVDVNGCRFVGLEFRGTGTTVRRLVKLADTTAITGGVLFEDCVFHGADTGSVNGASGLSAMDGTNAVTGLVVRRCAFTNLGKTPFEVGVIGIPYAKIEDNLFAIDTPSGFGIRLEDTAAFATGKGAVIRNNDFIGQSLTSPNFVGISIVGTEHTTAAHMIRTNYFAYCALASITADKITDGVIENYVGDNAGGAKVDSGA